MQRPSLSVVLPNYNHARFLRRSIQHIAEQTRPPDELIVLDDASTDNSLEVLRELASTYKFMRLVENDVNQGVNAANNRLLEMVCGDYLHLAAADDYLLPTFFETAMDLAERHPQAGHCFGRMQVRNEQDALLSVVGASGWSQPLFADPGRFCQEFLDAELATQALAVTTIFRRDAFQEVGAYRPELGSWADTFAWRAVGLKYGVCYAPIDFGVHTKHGGGFSDRGKQSPKEQLDIAQRAANLMNSPEFRDIFPADYVRRWRRQFRRLTIWSYWLGADFTSPHQRASFWRRNWRRLPRTLLALGLLFYPGK